MKTLIAKLCIWVLGKLGYNNSYVKGNEITITMDVRDAVKALKKLTYEAEQLKKALDGL